MSTTKSITGKIQVCDLKRETAALGTEIERCIARVLKSGRYILGPELESFEETFACYVGCKYAVGVASGTEALQISLAAMSIGTGDEVITPVNTAIPTAMAIVAAGAKPVFVDVGEASLNIDVSLTEKAITPRTKAVMPVHLYGNPCAIDAVSRLARKHNLKMIEDCAQAHGAEYARKKAGSFGDAGAFSFYPTKNLACYGDGGIIVTDSKELAGRMRLIRNYGQATRYECVITGINSRLDEIQAAILSVKLKHLDSFNGRRIKIAALYRKELGGIDEIGFPLCAAGSKCVFHLFVMRCKNREDLREYLDEKGVMTEVHYPVPLHMQKTFRYLGYKKGDFAVAEKAADEILSLPIFPTLKDSEVKYICGNIREFYGNS